MIIIKAAIIHPLHPIYLERSIPAANTCCFMTAFCLPTAVSDSWMLFVSCNFCNVSSSSAIHSSTDGREWLEWKSSSSFCDFCAFNAFEIVPDQESCQRSKVSISSKVRRLNWRSLILLDLSAWCPLPFDEFSLHASSSSSPSTIPLLPSRPHFSGVQWRSRQPPDEIHRWQETWHHA